MRKLLNTLYVTTPKSYLWKDGLAIVVSVEQQERLRLPVHNLNGIVCFGQVSCSPALMRFCAENEILISFLDRNGQFQARVEGPVSGNVLLRRAQYRTADDPGKAAAVTVMLLAGKVANERAVLRRHCREHPEAAPVLEPAIARQGELLEQVCQTGQVDVLRGLEGKAADVYFSVFNTLRLNPDPAFEFAGRSRRPPLDRINAMLSFAYTLLLHEVVGAMESVGLDPAAGFLHCDRPGRPSLALDMMEEFRSWVGDRFVLSLLNNRRIGAGDFTVAANGAVLLTDDGRKTFLGGWQQRKQEVIEHPFAGEKMPLGLLFFVQARILAKYLRGEIDCYVPFVRK